MQAVYLETSIFGYLASRTSADLITAGNQRLTMQWWDNHRNQFDLFVSQAVIAECRAGDSIADDERLAFLEDLPILDIDDETRQLAKTIMADVPLPTNADVDALHIAVAAMSGMDYLLTWN
jgi:predicted nucleic acid-binding protein